MRIELTVADHEKNGFVTLARWPRMSKAETLAAVAAIDAEISDEMEPDRLTGPFTFILDIMDGYDLHDTGQRSLPMQVAMRLAPDQVRTWLEERPEPDDAIDRRVPVLSRFFK
ncbi:hypothetical protein GCM10011491_41340 [Brucella endophytica]|uniref:Uncharacterized protein n=2 Tax=Brucella endophytica TaxID=1963359 RepID=A0A916WLH5_9HYPH|nr:hypothetical protein [Brucella endophytica]GGB09120.1 hypothetical protein GCM10011491_41340 [Brucella endophytica]